MAKMQWFYIPNYTMKCRIYPNAEAAAAIDAAIHAVQSFHNCVLWDLFNHFINTIEKEEKKRKMSSGIYPKTQMLRAHERFIFQIIKPSLAPPTRISW